MLSSLYAGHPGSIMLERLCRPISVTVQHLGGQRVPSLLGYAQCCSFSSSRTFSILHLFMLVLCTKFLCYPTSKTFSFYAASPGTLCHSYAYKTEWLPNWWT